MLLGISRAPARDALETLAIRHAASRDRDNAHRERDVTTDLQDHRNLVELVGAGDQQGAEAEMERHLDRSRSNSLQTFRLREHAEHAYEQGS